MPIVSLVINFRIEKRVEKQLKEFKTGLFEIIPQSMLSIFDERELEVRRWATKGVVWAASGHRLTAGVLGHGCHASC